MRVSKHIKVDKNVLVEWIFDDDNFLTEDYRIIEDTLHKTRAFSQNEKTGVNTSVTNNMSRNQLFSLNATINKWGVVNTDPVTNKYAFMQYQTFSGNVPFKYDIIRIHFPVNYTFADKLGCLLSINVFNKEQNKKFSLCNYFYDKTDVSRQNELQYGKPFTFDEKLWGKYIELQVPSLNAMTRDYQALDNNTRRPTEGSIHKNLVVNDFDLLDPESPAFIGFSFLAKKEDVFGQKAYVTTEPFNRAVSFVPEYENLSVAIAPSQQGDYFEIYGIFNGNLSDFNTFMRRSAVEGKKYYIIYEIATYEKNLKTRTEQQIVTDADAFDRPIEYRPIIKFSTTTALIEVTMRLINSSDESTIERKTTYAMLQDEVGKYSKWLTKINTVGAYKPKIYNSRPESIQLQLNQGTAKTVRVSVPCPVMVDRLNIIAKNKSEQVQDTVWYGLGDARLVLFPTDNVVQFALAQGTNATGIKPFIFGAAVTVLLVFKSTNTLVEVPLYHESGAVDLNNGLVTFKITEAHVSSLRSMELTGENSFYITIRNEAAVSTVVYAGKYNFFV